MYGISSFRLQPTFIVESNLSVEAATQRVHQLSRRSRLHKDASVAGNCIDFRIEKADQRFWSPHLSVQWHAVGSKTEFFGRFSPRPEIWTMFIAIYGVILIGVFAASIYGYVQWFIGQTPWVLLLVPSGLFAITCLHVASLLGQRFSADQMILLRLRFDQLEHALLNGQTELRRES